ncbi:MAG TPA: hypothetical protein PLT66_08445, partial [Bacillota bacterium]|nr:hypothetical protein [Bacillota bacterium]
ALLSYPNYGVKAIENKNGKTYASSHGAYFFNYPKNDAFTLKTITFSSAVFSFPYNEKSYTLSIDLSTERLSNSVFCIVRPQYTGLWEKNPALDAYQNSASASRLNGSVLVINVFLNDSASTWTSDEREAALKLQSEGYAIIESEAQKHGVSLDLTVTDMSDSLIYKHKNEIGTVPEDSIWVNQMFAYTTYGSLSGYIAAYFDVSAYDSYCVCFFINKNGESYSVCCSNESFETSIYGIERCIMFCVPGKSADTATPVIFARELLHMFGAQYLDDSAAAQIYFPNDLMASEKGSEINDYTAFRIGWKNSIDSLLDGITQ